MDKIDVLKINDDDDDDELNLLKPRMFEMQMMKILPVIDVYLSYFIGNSSRSPPIQSPNILGSRQALFRPIGKGLHILPEREIDPVQPSTLDQQMNSLLGHATVSPQVSPCRNHSSGEI